eukprot:781033-Pyramimonas_sp.AAC.1
MEPPPEDSEVCWQTPKFAFSAPCIRDSQGAVAETPSQVQDTMQDHFARVERGRAMTEEARLQQYNSASQILVRPSRFVDATAMPTAYDYTALLCHPNPENWLGLTFSPAWTSLRFCTLSRLKLRLMG